MNIQAAAVALACRKGISFQAARALLEPKSPRSPGDIRGSATGPGTPNRPARPKGCVNPAPAAAPDASQGGGTCVTGKDGVVARSPEARPAAAPSPPPVTVLDLPPPPPPAEAPERRPLGRAEELAAIDAWLAANPVRREPDFGELQEIYRLFQRFGHRMLKSNRHGYYVLDDFVLKRADLLARAKRLQALEGKAP